MTYYKIKFDHIIDGKYSAVRKTKAEARKLIKSLLKRFPYIIMTIYKLDKNGVWVSHERWAYEKDFETKRWKFTQLSV